MIRRLSCFSFWVVYRWEKRPNYFRPVTAAPRPCAFLRKSSFVWQGKSRQFVAVLRMAEVGLTAGKRNKKNLPYELVENTSRVKLSMNKWELSQLDR